MTRCVVCNPCLVVFLECEFDFARVNETVDELGGKKQVVSYSGVVYFQQVLVLVAHRKHAGG